MRYIDKQLLTDEIIVYRTAFHWIVFFIPLFFTALVAGFFMYGQDMPLINYGSLVIAIYFWMSAYIKFLTGDFAVTNQRVIMKTGLLRINTIEVFIQRIEAVEVERSIIGRLFNYGTVIITGIGGSKEPIRQVDDPLMFRRKVQEQIEIMLSKQQEKS
jgi:uncharacterized membrane protein YdbT with pleckstrin-like domain